MYSESKLSATILFSAVISFASGPFSLFVESNQAIVQFRYIKIQPKTIDLSTRLWGINTEFVGFIPQSLVTEVYCFRMNLNFFSTSKLVYRFGFGFGFIRA